MTTLVTQPTDIIFEQVSYLDTRDCLYLSTITKEFYKNIFSQSFWKAKWMRIPQTYFIRKKYIYTLLQRTERDRYNHSFFEGTRFGLDIQEMYRKTLDNHHVKTLGIVLKEGVEICVNDIPHNCFTINDGALEKIIPYMYTFQLGELVERYIEHLRKENIHLCHDEIAYVKLFELYDILSIHPSEKIVLKAFIRIVLELIDILVCGAMAFKSFCDFLIKKGVHNSVKRFAEIREEFVDQAFFFVVNGDITISEYILYIEHFTGGKLCEEQVVWKIAREFFEENAMDWDEKNPRESIYKYYEYHYHEHYQKDPPHLIPLEQILKIINRTD